MGAYLTRCLIGEAPTIVDGINISIIMNIDQKKKCYAYESFLPFWRIFLAPIVCGSL